MRSQRLLRVLLSVIDAQPKPLKVLISIIDAQPKTPQIRDKHHRWPANNLESPDKHHRCSAKDYALCNYIIEYQQQRWAASQPRGFRFFIQHHLLLAGLIDCLPILKASLWLSLPPCVPRTREATTLVCVCLAVTNASKHHAILGCVSIAVAYVNECHAAVRQPFGQPRPKIENQAWLSRCFSSYYFFYLKRNLFLFWGQPLFWPGLAGCSLIFNLAQTTFFSFCPVALI